MFPVPKHYYQAVRQKNGNNVKRLLAKILHSWAGVTVLLLLPWRRKSESWKYNDTSHERNAKKYPGEFHL